MAKDFKASQVRTTQIIASGSTSGKPSLVILSASSPGVNFDGDGISSVPSAVGRDVFVFVSGTVGSFGTSTRGVTLFGGDIVISGTAYNSTGNAYGNVAGSDKQVQFNDGGNFGADSGLTYDKATDALTIGGDLAVNGNDLTSTQTTFNLLNSTVTTLNVGGAATMIEIGAATGNTSINNGLTVDGNTTLGNATTDTTTVAGSLAVNGTAASSTNKITSTQTTFNLLNDTVTTLNIGGAATAVSIGNSAGTVTVPGNLTVNGTTTTVNTQNLVVQDPLIYFGSSSLAGSPNNNGGIALASGSNTPNQALVWGRVANDTWGAGKLDVTAGTTTDLTGMELVPIRAKRLELDTYGVGQQNHITASISGFGLNAQVGDFWPNQTLHLSGNSSTYISLDGPGPAGLIFPVNGGIFGPQVFINGNVNDAASRGFGYDSFGGEHRFTNVLGLSRFVKFTSGVLENPVAVFELTGSDQADQLTIGKDTNFYVSGSSGSKNSAVRGTAVFGGDVVISGTLHGGSPLKVSGSMALSGSLRLQTQDSAPSVGTNESVLYVLNDGGSKKLYWKNSDGAQQQVGTGGSTSGTFNEVNSGGTISLVTTASVSLAGAKGFSYGVNQVGVDTFFFVSGSLSSRGGSSGKVAVFGGHTVFSGALFGGVNSDLGRTLLRQEASQIAFSREEGLTAGSVTGPDIFMFVSGAIGSKDTSVRGTTVFGGDVVISGTLHGGSPLKIGSGLQVTGTLSISGSSALISPAMSGSLTKLADGTSYLIAGTNVTITTGTNGSVTIESTGGGGGGSGDPNATYIVLSATGSLNNERVLTPSTGIKSVDGGSGGNFTISIDDSVVATVSGTTFTGIVKANSGLSGSLTKLTDGTSYLIAGSNVTITTGSNGAVTIASTGGGGGGGDSFFSSTTNGSIFTSGSAAFRGLESSIDSPADKGSDVFFYVSGTSGGKGSALPSVTLFGGDIVASGTIYPGTDLGSNLGSPTNRFGNIYTGDLHLRNERGNWTIVEEEDYLCVVNNKTGKKFKMALIPLEE